MAETSSNLITNIDAPPPVKYDVSKSGGRMRIMGDAFEVASTEIDADGDIIRLARLPSNAVVWSIKLYCDALSGSGTADCGIYAAGETTATNDEVFATAVSVDALVNGTELRFEAGDATSIASVGKRLYEVLATPLTADPGVVYDICLTIENTASASGTVGFQIMYTID